MDRGLLILAAGALAWGAADAAGVLPSWLSISALAGGAATGGGPVPVSGGSAAISTDQDTLARTMWGEARGEGRAGQVAVAWTVRNRVRDPRKRWPTLYWKACKQAGQFSCWNLLDVNRPKLLAVTAADAVFKDCVSIAGEVINGTINDPTKGSNYFYDSSIPQPAFWKSKKIVPTVTIGRLHFGKG